MFITVYVNHNGPNVSQCLAIKCIIVDKMKFSCL